ncbi:hypothetical protein [Streptomyces sp. NRRL F-4428]|uniref:hypothetical protein n=1 Tax=Streptomyces sp. NRRL F-4428 TaxID=1609137 RepID=UPI000B33DDA0|nr:hypothetical protein [Streptomyces sp. NRRL F-4428]
MSATNAAERLGFAAVGALLAGGLLLAACTLPDDRPDPYAKRTGVPGRERRPPAPRRPAGRPRTPAAHSAATAPARAGRPACSRGCRATGDST